MIPFPPFGPSSSRLLQLAPSHPHFSILGDYCGHPHTSSLRYHVTLISLAAVPRSSGLETSERPGRDTRLAAHAHEAQFHRRQYQRRLNVPKSCQTIGTQTNRASILKLQTSIHSTYHRVASPKSPGFPMFRSPDLGVIGSRIPYCPLLQVGASSWFPGEFSFLLAESYSRPYHLKYFWGDMTRCLHNPQTMRNQTFP